MTNTLVLGVGNTLLTDEGVGIKVLERLQEDHNLPEEVQVLDGGTLGLDLLYYLEGKDNLLIIDAVEMGQEPGTLLRLENDEVPAFLSLKMSPHQIGIPDMLVAAKLKDLYPERVVLWGIQPSSMDIGLELSPVISEQVGPLVQNAVNELRQWGLSVEAKARSED